MKENDKKRFAECLVAFAEMYNQTLSRNVQKLWFETLSDYEIEAVEKAFRKLLRSPDFGQFMPKPNDVIRMLEGSSFDIAAIAWTKAERAIGSPGLNYDICFDDAIINRVISDLGGWVKFCLSEAKDWPFIEKDFKERYKAYRSRGNLTEYTRQLTGHANAENVPKGYPAEPPRLFGDVEKARQVLVAGTTAPLFTSVSADENTMKLIK